MSIIETLAFGGTSTGASFEASGVEFENEIYLENFDLAQVQSMAESKEHQEQWGIYVPKSDDNAVGGSLRVRKTVFQDESVKIEDCCKTELGADGKMEDENRVSETRFKQFEQLADQGLIKVRYTIPAQTQAGVDFKFEVDVFYNKDGELIPWAKVDAEMEKGTVFNPSLDIPFTCTSLLYVTPEMKANNEGGIRAKVAELYEKYFRTSNKHVSA